MSDKYCIMCKSDFSHYPAPLYAIHHTASSGAPPDCDQYCPDLHLYQIIILHMAVCVCSVTIVCATASSLMFQGIEIPEPLRDRVATMKILSVM